MLAFRSACAQAESEPYLLRLEHETMSSDSCVLLQKTGVYHLELTETGDTKVFEGALNPTQLQQVSVDVEGLTEELSQRRIEEPLIVHRELLKLDISNHGRWSEVSFLSTESQEPFRQSLQPLIRWLNDLHKLPHKEVSEDAGKNNCLAPTKIALKKRGDGLQSASGTSNVGANAPAQPSARAPSRAPAALLRLDSLGLKSSTYFQNCVLVLDDGSYRTEDRSQKNGSKKVDTRINGGKLTPIEISQLQEILSTSALAEIRHRETSRLELPVSGEILELKIPRPSGLQDIVLSSTFDRPGIPFFYSGDGSIARAQPLLNFLSEHVTAKTFGSLDPQLRNGCTEAP
jgi:hypothetical protein